MDGSRRQESERLSSPRRSPVTAANGKEESSRLTPELTAGRKTESGAERRTEWSLATVSGHETLRRGAVHSSRTDDLSVCICNELLLNVSSLSFMFLVHSLHWSTMLSPETAR